MSRHKPHKRTWPKGLRWLIGIALIAALYYWKRESFWGIVGVLACPMIVIAVIASAVKKAGSPSSAYHKRREWQLSGQTDKEWSEENDRRILGEEY